MNPFYHQRNTSTLTNQLHQYSLDAVRVLKMRMMDLNQKDFDQNRWQCRCLRSRSRSWSRSNPWMENQCRACCGCSGPAVLYVFIMSRVEQKSVCEEEDNVSVHWGLVRSGLKEAHTLYRRATRVHASLHQNALVLSFTPMDLLCVCVCCTTHLKNVVHSKPTAPMA